MSVDEVIETIEHALRTVMELQQPALEERTWGLFAIHMGEEEVQLFENANGGTMLSPIGHAAQCIGLPAGLGQYFLDFLYREPMPMKWARIVAVHLVARAKKYSSFVDGDTHLLEIPRTGTPRQIEDQGEIAGQEQYLGQLDQAFRMVLPDGTANDDTLLHRIKTLTRVIERLGQQFAINASPETLIIDAHERAVVIKLPVSTPTEVAQPDSPATTDDPTNRPPSLE